MNINDWITSKLSIDEFNKKYKHKEETFDEFLDRVSRGNKQVQQLIIDKKFIFGGRILANRGLQNEGYKITYSNCYVLSPPEDNIESIYETCGKLARTFSYGGGVGIDISKLRPKGAAVHNAAKTTTGAVSFMSTFSQVAETIGQKGRRGALMISMDVSHPDIEEFIDIKTDLEKVTKANISVRITDEFIKAVKNKESYECNFELEDGSIIRKTIDANKLMDKLALNNWDFAEPGILYWDKIQNYNILQHFDFEYAGVNPCAEEPLPAGGSCLLGAINLSKLIKNPFTDNAYFDKEEFRRIVEIGVYALNDVLLEGLSLHPLEEQRRTVRDYRQIGLGLMGLADAMIKMKITYGSKESLDFIDEVGTCMLETALLASNKYLIDNPVHGAFKDYDAEKILNSDIVKHLMTKLNIFERNNLTLAIECGLFNSQLLTVAPTGTIAGLFDTSYGVEPNFGFSYTRKTESLHDKDTYYKIESKIVEEYREITGDKGDLPEYFISTHQLNPYNRIDVQATIQKYIDASISSTLNLSNDVSPEEVKSLYLYGAKAGVKGLTVYRNGCKRDGILTIEEKTDEKDNTDDLSPVERAKSMLKFGDTILVDDSVIGIKRKLKTGCGSLHCTFYFCPETGELREVFLDKGSKGGCLSLLNAVSRLSSLCARKGAPVEEIVDQLESVLICPSYSVAKSKDHTLSKGSSCATAVANAMLNAHKQFIDEFLELDDDAEIEIKTVQQEPKKTKAPKNDYYIVCPECGEKSAMKTEGCISCHNCGYSKCN